jgi:hypothetical protein
MKELKGLETHEFYSRFFVETALLKQEQMNVTSEEAKKFMGLGEGFYKRFNDLSIHSHDKEKQKEFMGWFHTNLVNELGYKNLEPRVYETKGKDGIVIRGTVKLVDDEELWLIEGHAGYSFNEEDPFEITPNCSSVHLLDEEFNVDKSKNYRKIFDELFSDENESVGWAIYLAGEKTFLLEKEKWLDKGTFIEVDWQEAFNNKSSDTFKAILGLFGARGFKVENGEIPHNLLAETAHREAHGVTKSLKYSVRDALEILINEVLDSHKQNSSPYIENIINTRPEDLAKDLSGQGLRYLYRLLFLFYVEARGRESEILPVKSPSYQLGYSLENIRNLELANKSSIKNGNFIQQTLERTFTLMFSGYNINEYAEFEENIEEDDDVLDEAIYSAGFECPKVGALLFDPRYTPVFDEVKLSDAVMQKVVAKLSLAEVGSGKKAKTQRISYANLGLNQLGAVYEGLLSLKAVITDRDYYTVVLGTRDEEFLIPTEDRSKFKGKIKQDSNGNEILHEKGKFLFRTMGYERKYSASFYTDEALTQCLVKECLQEYFKDNETPKASEIENMKVLEPAMGSGAFLNEVANQLAVYLAKAYKRERKEYKDTNMKELNDIAKEYIMRNCLYGVDLNPMAAELAKVSLWLNCIRKDSKSAFHDFKIRHGNSLVGAFLRQKTLWNSKVHHFLAPMPEMVDTYLDARELGDKKRPFFDEKQMANLKDIKDSYKNIKNYQDRLEVIAKVLDEYSEIHTKKRIQFQNLIKNTDLSESEINDEYQKYTNDNEEFHKLKLIMDYWTSLWFWNPKDIYLYPTAEQFIEDVENIIELRLKEYSSVNKEISRNKKYSRVRGAREVIKSIPFFHYDLEYPEVFKNGGFDLVVGNPPWAKLSWSDVDFFNDHKLEMQVKKIGAKEKIKVWESTLDECALVDKYRKGYVIVDGIRQYLRKSKCYSFNDMSEGNTYKYFWQRFQLLSKENAIYGLIKQGGITSDNGMDDLRKTYYKELKALYRFVNHLKLFSEIGDLNEYVMSISRKAQKNVQFTLIDMINHPIVIDRCRATSSFEPYPGRQNSQGKFSLKGHPDRILQVDTDFLKRLTGLENKNSNDFLTVSLPKIYGKPEWQLIEKAIDSPKHLSDMDFYWTKMFDETSSTRKGLVELSSLKNRSMQKVVLTGPSMYVSTPYYKEPNAGCKNHADFSRIDLNSIDDDFQIQTKYTLTKDGMKTTQSNTDLNEKFRLCAREYVSTTGTRTFSSALYPPGIKHISAVVSTYLEDNKKTTLLAAYSSSLIFDFYARNLTTGHLTLGFWEKLPYFENLQISNELIVRSLRLNCLSIHYDNLWSELWDESFKTTKSLDFYPPSKSYKNLKPNWSWDTPIRDDFEREQTLCEIDSLVAILFCISKSDLIKLYRSQFGALQRKMKDYEGQNEEDSFPRAKIMEAAYDMFLEHFGVTEKDVVAGYFQDKKKAKAA